MDVKAWISNPKVIAKSKKGYAHFDLRTDITKFSEYVTNPEKVARHSFYPFIHYVMRMDKYNKKTGVKHKCVVLYPSTTKYKNVWKGLDAFLKKL